MMHSATNTRVKGHGKLIEKNQKVTAQVTGRICRSQKTIMLPDRSTYRLAQLGICIHQFGNELFEASMWDDCVKVSTLLSSQSAQSFINYQNSRTHRQITELLMEARASLDLEHENGYTPLMISAYNGHRVFATLLLAARSKIHIDVVELDTAIIGGVGIEKLPGSCKGRLGVWLHEDFQCNPEDEEEEKEEDSMWTMTRINVEEDEDEEKEEPLSD